MRLIFAGTPRGRPPALSLIDAGHEIVLVLTQRTPRASAAPRFTQPVKEFALGKGLEVATPSRASAPEVVERIAALETDAAGVVAYGQILPTPLIAATRLGW